MRTILIIVILVHMFPAPVNSQINLEINGYDTVVQTFDPKHRPFVGRFTFREEPQPLQPVRVDFTLTVSHPYALWIDTNPWIIKVLWDKKAVKVEGDSIFSWPGSHEVGDQFSGSFEVVPLLSGLHGFSLFWDYPGAIDTKLDVRWCFDKDGKLSFLGRTEIIGCRAPECTQDWCTFFAEDSVYVIGPTYKTPPSGEAFSYSYSITPPFRIKDTSTVRYYLTSHHDFISDLQVEFIGAGVELVSPLHLLRGDISKGETVIYEVRVVPLAVRNIHDMRLLLEHRRPEILQSSGNVILCETLFNDDGSLRFISDRWLMDVDSTMLPSAFPPLEKGDSEMIRVEPGKDKVFRHKY
jgi:hypothetical protein